jgi:hypothetical protein
MACFDHSLVSLCSYFFDDILIYNETWSEHLQHVHQVFTALQEHQLFVKRSKCVFGTRSVAYLGHVISETGVAMDNEKVQAECSNGWFHDPLTMCAPS